MAEGGSWERGVRVWRAAVGARVGTAAHHKAVSVLVQWRRGPDPLRSRDPGRQGGKEVGRGSGARVRARACVRGSAVGARIQVAATRVGVPARESAWRRPDLCVGVPVGGLA